MILYTYTCIHNKTIYTYMSSHHIDTIRRDLPMSGASKQRRLLHQVHLLHQAVGEFSGLDIGIAGVFNGGRKGEGMTMGWEGGNLEHIYIYININVVY